MPDTFELVGCSNCRVVLGTGHDAGRNKDALWRQHVVDAHSGDEKGLSMLAQVVEISEATPGWIFSAWAQTQKVG